MAYLLKIISGKQLKTKVFEWYNKIWAIYITHDLGTLNIIIENKCIYFYRFSKIGTNIVKK